MKIERNTRLMADANVLINDFFYRQPDFGMGRVVPERQAQIELYRQKVHQTLEELSKIDGIQVFIPTYMFLRVASLLADLFVPNELAKQELLYLRNNYNMIDITLPDIEQVLWQVQTTPNTELDLDMEDYFLLHACRAAQCSHLLTSTRKGYELLEEIVLVRPESVIFE
ncbi:hypothetical protein SAMN05421780_11223 [Flexibacter flexilis DSM 6793]|uniref:PIN domain-containing protein n=1 Tax=Flexibacter flexilis DSM 6793 TaxID=927664 RepID=A0A1I1N0Q5_9BACT|nr:hypothetical protein [Flexibacter flexilis]SFC91284.1 hypothetical protein SAMN05421780_11223 [Flexibacter flexilis DSM 6793]